MCVVHAKRTLILQLWLAQNGSAKARGNNNIWVSRKKNLKEKHRLNPRAFIARRRENAYFMHFMIAVAQSCPHLLSPKGLYPSQ